MPAMPPSLESASRHDLRTQTVVTQMPYSNCSNVPAEGEQPPFVLCALEVERYTNENRSAFAVIDGYSQPERVRGLVWVQNNQLVQDIRGFVEKNAGVKVRTTGLKIKMRYYAG